MIQRPQSLFLLLAALWLTLSLFTPFAIRQISPDGPFVEFRATCTTYLSSPETGGPQLPPVVTRTDYLVAAVIVCGGAFLASIFLFGRRRLQFRVVVLTTVLTGLLFTWQTAKSFPLFPMGLSDGPGARGFYFQLGALSCGVLAFLLILRDIRIVRDSDRIR